MFAGEYDKTTNLCDDKPIDEIEPLIDVKEFDRNNVPLPPYMALSKATVGGRDFQCWYSQGDNGPGTLKCSGYKVVQCEDHPKLNKPKKCEYTITRPSWVTPRLRCRIKVKDKEE